MASVTMERVISPAQYESLRYSVTVTDSDYPRLPDETPEHHLARLHERAYKEMLAFQVFHKVLMPEQARQEILSLRKAYNLNGKVTVADGTASRDHQS